MASTDLARTTRLQRALMMGAVAVGLVGGSYGIASAASGGSGASGSTGSSSSGSGTTQSLLPPSTANGQAPSGPPPGGTPWGHQRSDETLLTGDALTQVTAAAKAKVPGGTIVRVETDADGHAKYEAHMTDSSGNPVTVYVNASYEVVSVENGH
jgi:hypothetical protein